MAREVHKFTATCPAGTLPTAPVVINLNMPPRAVTDLEIIVPPGPNGMMGFAIGYGGNPVLPYEPGQWFVTSNEILRWPLEEHITSGAWQCFMYNAGAFPHSIEIRFLCDLPSDPGVNASSLAPLSQLQPAS